MGTDGFEFVEYAAPDPAALASVFERMGFTAVAGPYELPPIGPHCGMALPLGDSPAPE
jgi:hypothetical protein